MTIQQLQYVMEISRTGSVSKAAKTLFLSQPNLSNAIKNLENELGCRLFTRSKSGMKLTPEGRTFYSYVSAGCAQFFKGESDLKDRLSLEKGTISISATETALHCYLFQAMEEFSRKYPKVHFQILNNSTRDSIQAVRDGKVDMAVVSSLPLHMGDPLKMKVLRSYREILIGGPRFEQLKGRKCSLRELSDLPWISLTSEAISRNFLNSYFLQYGLTFSPDLELATTDLILPAVRHNLGIGFIPEEIAAEDLKAGVVFAIDLEEAFPERNVLMIRDSEYPLSVAAKAFQKFAQERE